MRHCAQLELMAEKFIAFLGKTRDYHVIFYNGTIVRLSGQEGEEFQGYTGEVGGKKERIWNIQRTVEGEAGVIIRKSYKILIDDEYPHPGDENADRIAISLPGEKDIWMIIWTSRNPNIANIVMAKNDLHAANIAGEYRRCDFEEPCASIVITPNLEMIRV